MADQEKYFKVAGHALISKNNKFLVIRRCPENDYMPNTWDIPGGTVEFIENIYQCIEREVDEESNLKINIKEPLIVYDHISGEFRHQFTIVYNCDYQAGEVKLNPEEHDKFMWVTLEEMASLPKIAFLEALYQQLTAK